MHIATGFHGNFFLTFKVLDENPAGTEKKLKPVPLMVGMLQDIAAFFIGAGLVSRPADLVVKNIRTFFCVKTFIVGENTQPMAKMGANIKAKNK